MYYVQVDVHLRRNRKYRRLRRLLGASDGEALLVLYELWSAAAIRAEGGDVCPSDAQELALTLDYDGDADKLMDALLNCGGKDEPGFIVIDSNRVMVYGYEEVYGARDRKRQYDRDYQKSRRTHEEIVEDRNDVVTTKTINRNPKQSKAKQSKAKQSTNARARESSETESVARVNDVAAGVSPSASQRRTTNGSFGDTLTAVSDALTDSHCTAREIAEALDEYARQVKDGERIDHPVPYCKAIVARMRDTGMKKSATELLAEERNGAQP